MTHPDRPHRFVRAPISNRNLALSPEGELKLGHRMEETARVLDDWSPCKVCGGSQMTTMHLYAPEPKPRPETIRRRLAAWAEHTSKPGWERRMLKEAP